jgi:hypothetical protein
MGRFVHVGGLARARAHYWRAGLAVLAGLVLLAGTGCSTAPMWVGANSSIGVHPAPGSPGASGPGGNTVPGGGKTSGGAAGMTGGSSTGPGGSPRVAPGGPSSRTPGTSGRTPGGPSGTGRAVLFGGDVPLTKEEPQLGRTLAIVRVYDRIGQRFPNRREATFMSHGSTILVSFDTLQRHGPSYASVAAGREDGTIRAFLDSVEQAAVKYRLRAIYVTFEHEANNSSKHAGLGSPAEFIRAWDHVHQLAVDAHLDWNQGGRLHWVLILTHFGYINGSAALYWDSEVPHCNYEINNSSSSLAALASMGHAPDMQGQVAGG